MEFNSGVWNPKITGFPDYRKLPNESGTTEDVFYSAWYQDIPPEFRIVAEKELNETEENKAKGLRKLREFIKKEKLPEMDDFILIIILRICKYNFKKSVTKLKKFLKARETILSQVDHLDLKKVEMIVEHCGIGILPYRDRHGRLVVFTRPAAMNEDYYSMDNVMLTGLAMVMLIITYPLTSITGVAYIGDGKFNSASSYLTLLKAYHQHMWTFLDLPVRIGRADIPNAHFLTKWFFNIIRPFISSKILSRISFESDMENLKNNYHPDMLPEEFGGNMGPLDQSIYKGIAVDYIKRLKAESQVLKGTAK